VPDKRLKGIVISSSAKARARPSPLHDPVLRTATNSSQTRAAALHADGSEPLLPSVGLAFPAAEALNHVASSGERPANRAGKNDWLSA